MQKLTCLAMVILAIATCAVAMPMDSQYEQVMSHLLSMLSRAEAQETAEARIEQERDPFEREVEGSRSIEEQMEEDTTINDQKAEIEGYQNKFDGALRFTCPAGKAIKGFRSDYSTGHRDRRFEFTCVKIPSKNRKCHTTDFLNGWDAPLVFMCPENQYMAGVESHHDNGREDRRWKATCCESPGLRTKDCSITPTFINQFRATINFPACQESDRFITGLYSFHDNGQEDRLWRIITCRAGE